MIVLVLNCGSSSLKFQLISTSQAQIEESRDKRLAEGIVERIGGEAIVRLQAAGNPPKRFTAPLRDMRSAVEMVLRWACAGDSGIDQVNSACDITAVGHRVVHGGEHFSHSLLIDESVLRGIEDCIDLAPLHNPANIKGITAAREVFGPEVPQVAVFDTAFHQTLPEFAYLYGLPYQLYRRHRIRRYGFHGTSHRYLAYRYRQIRGIPRDKTNVITLHLGNGCSAAAIRAGDSVDTSMGLTPLEGLVMGTRSGDIDPATVEFIATKEGLTPGEVDTLLNKQSGLLGLSGLTNDMRELLDEARENNDRRARLAVEIFCYRARKYIGAYLAALNGTDSIIFAGGIGENSPEVRARICEGLAWFGVELDKERNQAMIGGREGLITKDNSRLPAMVIPTNEELLIARDTARVVLGVPQRF